MTGEESAIQTEWVENRDAEVAAACPSFETLSAYFDRELPEVEMRAIRTHLANCWQCAPVIADFRNIKSLLADAETCVLPRSFALTESMAAQARAAARRPAPITPFARITRRLGGIPFLPIMTAMAALLLIAAIAGENWTGNDSSSSTNGETARVIMIGGEAVTVEDDATFGAASAGAMNGNASGTDGSDASTAASATGASHDWFNWWRPFEAILGLTVAALIVTMVSRRRPRRE